MRPQRRCEAALAATSCSPAPDVVESLGGGWTAEEALAIAAYAAMVHEDDVRAALLLAVNHGGDSDSTGAICGNFLGARHGLGAVPAEWVEANEVRDLARQVAADLVIALSGDVEQLLDRYPGG